MVQPFPRLLSGHASTPSPNCSLSEYVIDPLDIVRLSAYQLSITRPALPSLVTHAHTHTMFNCQLVGCEHIKWWNSSNLVFWNNSPCKCVIGYWVSGLSVCVCVCVCVCVHMCVRVSVCVFACTNVIHICIPHVE